MLVKAELLKFLKITLCRMACDPSIDIYYTYSPAIPESRFYGLCKLNGYQLDAALTEIVDELVVDEYYNKFLNDKSVSIDDYEDNLFSYVMSFVGFLMVYNIHPNTVSEIRNKFIDLYK
jgi:hypothetical protein